MNNRIAEIEAFLAYFSQLYYYNPNLQITYKTIYHNLMQYGLSEEEKNNADIKNNFSNWINRFKERKNINVYWDQRQARFLQFRNESGIQNNTDCKYFKLYMSFPKEKIYDCVNKIFDFIEQNNLTTLSKVSDMVRSDSVVLRMQNEEDARKIMNFINNDSEIVESAKLTNPFLVRNGVVGIGYDDMLSYNSVLSDLMEKYYQKHREGNTLKNVSLNDFKNYVSQVYNSNFRDINGIQKFSEENIYRTNAMRCGSMAHTILNYDQIYQTIMKSLDVNTKSDDLINTINNHKSVNNNAAMINYYDVCLKSSTSTIKNNTSLTQTRRIVDKYILYAIDKYGIEGVSKYLNNYLEGNDCAITRDNNFRLQFVQYVNRETLQKILVPDSQQYIYNIYNINKQLYTKEDVSLNNIDINLSKYVLDEYILFAILKYGRDNVYAYIASYVNNNLFAITRDNNFRQKFQTYLSPRIVLSITGINIEEYIEDVIKTYNNTNNLSSQR